MYVARVEGHSFLAPLASGAVVVDLGASRGRFAQSVRDRFDSAVFAVEPVPALYGELPEWLPALPVAVGQLGELKLNRNRDASTRLSEEGADTLTVEALDLGEILDRFGLGYVDLLKVDVEGAELDVLDDPAIRRCSQVTVEFHDFIAPWLRPAVTAACAGMRGKGFTMLRFSHDNTDVLFVRGRISPPRRAWLLLRFKYVRGSRRLARRLAA